MDHCVSLSFSSCHTMFAISASLQSPHHASFVTPNLRAQIDPFSFLCQWTVVICCSPRSCDQCHSPYIPRMMLLRIILLCSLMLSCVRANVAVPYPGEIYENQPDGTVATLRLSGHPYTGVFQTDSLGHPVLRDENGWFVYASYDNPSHSNDQRRRQLRPSNRRVGIDAPPSHPPPDLTTLAMTRSRRDAEVHADAPPMDSRVGNMTEIGSRLNDLLCQGMDRSPWCPNRPVNILNLGRSTIIQGDQWGGVLNVIVILVKFSDQADRPVADVSQFNTLFNGDGFDDAIIPTGSVKRFYKIQSGGKLEVNAFVEDWIVAPETEEFYSFGKNGLDAKFTQVANGALDRMDARGTDWSFFDRDQVNNEYNCLEQKSM
jgi:hypothetical protein